MWAALMRHFVFGFSATLAGLGAALAQEEGVPPLFPGSTIPLYETERITDNLYSFRHTFYRSIFIVTDDGIIATDPLAVEAGPILRQEIGKITDKPVKYVAYSHSHWDHAAGGQVFKDEGATFVAQEKCLENLKTTNPSPDVVMPDVTFSDSHVIELGGRSLELFYYGPSHDNCLSVMVVQPENILFIVDLTNPPSGWYMFYNPTQADNYLYNTVPYFKAVEAMIERKGIEQAIGGHIQIVVENGSMKIAPTVGPASIVEERRMFYEESINAVRAEYDAGTPPESIPAKLVDERVLADKIIGYNPEAMKTLFARFVVYVETGE